MFITFKEILEYSLENCLGLAALIREGGHYYRELLQAEWVSDGMNCWKLTGYLLGTGRPSMDCAVRPGRPGEGACLVLQRPLMDLPLNPNVAIYDL